MTIIAEALPSRLAGVSARRHQAIHAEHDSYDGRSPPAQASPDGGILASRPALRQRHAPYISYRDSAWLKGVNYAENDQAGSSRTKAVNSRIVCWVSGVGRRCAEIARQSTLTGVGSTSRRVASSPQRAEAVTPLAVSTA